MAAAAHEVSHLQTAPETGSKSGLHGGNGEICTVAAHFNGGAAESPPAKIEHPELHQVAPIWRLHGQPAIGVNVPFDSRAPPNSLLP